jgi:hypothetical protein
MGRFHDSRFQGVRLVCRLRRGSAASPSQTPQAAIVPETSNAPKFANEEEQDQSTAVATDASSQVPPQTSPDRVPEKYFVVKSLTTEDLERSVQSGVWATQAHNEATLSQAYEVC